MKACLGIILLMMPLLLLFSSNMTSINSTTNFLLALNKTLAYIETVNQSNYLVFYPNLQQAYSYARMANSTFSGDPVQAYALLLDARESAAVQLDHIYSYRTASFYVMLILTIATGVWLYTLVYGGSSKRKARRRS